MSDISPSGVPHIVASTFNTAMAGTEMMILVNVAKPKFDGTDFTGDIVFEPQVALHMSPQAAKELLILLQGSVENYEASFGPLRSSFIDERSKA